MLGFFRLTEQFFNGTEKDMPKWYYLGVALVPQKVHYFQNEGAMGVGDMAD